MNFARTLLLRCYSWPPCGCWPAARRNNNRHNYHIPRRNGMPCSKIYLYFFFFSVCNGNVLLNIDHGTRKNYKANVNWLVFFHVVRFLYGHLAQSFVSGWFRYRRIIRLIAKTTIISCATPLLVDDLVCQLYPVKVSSTGIGWWVDQKHKEETDRPLVNGDGGHFLSAGCVWRLDNSVSHQHSAKDDRIRKEDQSLPNWNFPLCLQDIDSGWKAFHPVTTHNKL